MDSLLAEVTRNGFVEGRHYGSVVVLDRTGHVLYCVGDPAAAVFGRSANKMMQALGMLRLGLHVNDRQLALTTASHSGSPEHLAVVESILDSVSLGVDALRNVAAAPLGRDESAVFARSGNAISALTMNCSGKHASMLATCVANKWDLTSYLEMAHPLQIALREVIETVSGEQSGGMGVDGCGAPAQRLSLIALARSLGAMAQAEEGSHAHRVITAIRNYPVLVGGHGRDITEFLVRAPRWVGKDGADGVMVLASPSGEAVAVKISDGAERPRIPVALAALRKAGIDVPTMPSEIDRPPIVGGGRHVGEVRPC